MNLYCSKIGKARTIWKISDCFAIARFANNSTFVDGVLFGSIEKARNKMYEPMVASIIMINEEEQGVASRSHPHGEIA